MQPLNICMFGNQLAPSKNSVYIGGSVNSAIQLSQSLAERGHEIHIVTIAPRDWDGDVPDDVTLPEWAHHHIFDGTAQHPGLVDGVMTFYEGTRALLEYCRSEEIDVIHSHSGFSVLASVPATVGRILDIPVVHTLYCPIPETDLDGMDKRLSSPRPARLTLNRIDHVFAMTRNVENSLHRHGIHHTSFLPPIIDTETYRPDLPMPTSVDLATDRPSVLFVGNTHPSKGIRYLIKAAGQLRRAGQPLQLILTTERPIPGDSERRTELDDLIEAEGLADDIEMVGIIDDMPSLLASVDVLAMPFTTTDGPSDYPIALLEAMACGTPSVGSEIGGITELLGEGRGILVPPKDADRLAAGIEDALAISGTETRAFIEENFSADAVVSDLEARYAEIIGLEPDAVVPPQVVQNN